MPNMLKWTGRNCATMVTHVSLPGIICGEIKAGEPFVIENKFVWHKINIGDEVGFGFTVVDGLGVSITEIFVNRLQILTEADYIKSLAEVYDSISINSGDIHSEYIIRLIDIITEYEEKHFVNGTLTLHSSHDRYFKSRTERNSGIKEQNKLILSIHQFIKKARHMFSMENKNLVRNVQTIVTVVVFFAAVGLAILYCISPF